MREFSFSTRIFFGEGALERLRTVKNKRVLIVTDRFMADSGVAERVASHLTDCDTQIFCGVIPDPPIEVVAAGVQALQSSNAQVVIAVGGGSSIDAAKAIRAVAGEIPGSAVSIEECFAIPTTSGTGSEVTEYAVISDTSRGVKYPLDDKTLRPPTAILDPALVCSVPPVVTADTGMDVLTHAVEAYISTGYNDFSDALSEKAVSLVFRWLPEAYDDGNNELAREKMHNASCMAGLCFNSAGLGLVHGIAHALGAKLHLPHGRCNAIALPAVLRYNARLDLVRGGEYSVTARKLQRLAKVLDLPASGVRLGAANFIREVERLRRRVGVPQNLKECGIEAKRYKALRDELVEAALNDATTKTNPRVPQPAEVGKLFDRLYGAYR